MAANKIDKSDWDDIASLRKEGKTLAHIGNVYGITRERVRQIVKAMGVERPNRVRGWDPEKYKQHRREVLRQRDIEREERVIANSYYARDRLSGRSEAAAQVAKAIQKGELLHPSNYECTDCGCKASEYDHRDYNYPLSVDPVCRGCNARRGQAKPKNGFFKKMIDLGHEPYAYRLHMKRLADAYGFHIPHIDSLPKRLTVEHWIQHWPLASEVSE